MRSALASCLVALVLVVGLTLSAGAQAPEPAPGASEYETALSSALAAHARGDYESARTSMERAHALEPSARTLRGLAIVAFAQERHLDAIRLLDEALASSVKPLTAELRKECDELLARAWAKLGRVTVALDPPEAEFFIDGEKPDFYAEHTVVLAPGSHTLSARFPGRVPYQVQFDVQPGDRRTLQLVLVPQPAPEVVEKVVYRTPEPAPDRGPAPALRPAFYDKRMRIAGLSGGGALLAGGIVLWGVGFKKLNELDAGCEDMVPKGCTPEEAQQRFDDDVRAYAVSSAVLAGTGAAVLLTVGALELWQWRQRKHGVELRASAGLVSVKGRF